MLDTGVDETHPDLAGAVVESKNFSDSDTTDDRVGHGTHVAATITGDGKYKGIAPDSKLVNGKVLGDQGGGRESDIIAGMEWAASKAKVVNMSLGSSWPDEGTDPMSLALNRITAQTGALFVVAAGNSGGPIGSPGVRRRRAHRRRRGPRRHARRVLLARPALGEQRRQARHHRARRRHRGREGEERPDRHAGR